MAAQAQGGPRWKRRCYNIATLRAEARRVLPRPVFDFVDGGAEDEWTLRRNESGFDLVSLLPRPLDGAGERDLTVELFGRTLSMPVLVAPTGLAGLLWPDGERVSARAAAAAGTVYCLSHGSVCNIEELAETGASPRWMQIHVYKDRGFSHELAARAAAAGYDGLVVTIDTQVLGHRERDTANGFTIPPRFSPATIAAMSLKLPWLFRMRHALRGITFGNYRRPGEGADLTKLAERMVSLIDPGASWDDIDRLREVWRGPLLIKGVMHPREAAEAAARGVDGVIVSNHGGRQLDGAASSIEALPGIVEAADGRLEVLLDGGVRRGADVVKALALGARACLLGRAQLFGLAVAGGPGIAHALEIMRTEIDRAMGLCGIGRVADIGPDLLLQCVEPAVERQRVAPLPTALEGGAHG